jgi:hypothetical protein
VIDTEPKIRCSSWARDVRLSPIATVGTYFGFLLVEIPLPWPRDIAEVPAIAKLAGLVTTRRIRVQALVPSSTEAGPTDRRVILHAGRFGARTFGGYQRHETTVGDSLEEAVTRLVASADSAAAELARPGTDILVCTHGRRDACCGSKGTELALQLAASAHPAGVHRWRTSHTGGHRFAPTFLVLPEGTGWAFADPILVHDVLERSVPFADVAARYRGCAGLGGPQVQALERDVLVSVGWELLDRPRAGYLTGEVTDDGGQVTRLDAGGDHWEGVVRPGRTLPVPDCMKPLSEATKTETEWIVSDLRSLS